MNTDLYKNIEERHYDSYYSDKQEYSYHNENELSNKDKVNIGAKRFLERKTFEILKNKGHGKILDFGSSIGEKTYLYSSADWEITGIDISSKSISVANYLSKKHNLNSNFLVMDCENLTFADNEFDIVYDFGTFSSLNMKLAIKELCRVLKPDGYLLAIETLGNNPLFMIKRRINFLMGSRTKWAINHIMKISDWEDIKKCFMHSEIYYFSLFTPYLSPFLRFIPRIYHFKIISFIERIDTFLFKSVFLKRLAFKTVVALHKPIKL